METSNMSHWEDDEEDLSYEEIEEIEERRAMEIVGDCKCGAMTIDSKGKLSRVADCCCGAY